jgi:hypothetical protein
MKTEAWFEADPFFAFCSGLWFVIRAIAFVVPGCLIGHFWPQIWAVIDSLVSPVVSIYS